MTARLVIGAAALALALPAIEAEARRPRAKKRCTIGIDTRAGTTSINGTRLPDLRLATLRARLGEPTRTRAVKSRHRYERWPSKGGRRVSELVEVVNHFYAYDRLGVVFYTRNAKPFDRSKDPTFFLIRFNNRRTFTNRLPPPLMPRATRCRVMINGAALEPRRSVLPPNITHRTNSFRLFKTEFAPASFATRVDSIYNTRRDRRALQLFLDRPGSGRPAYLVVR